MEECTKMTTSNIKGRGRGHGRGRGKGSDQKKNSITETKFCPHQMGRQQSVTHNTVKDHISQFIQKNYDLGKEVAMSLREMKEVDCNKKPKKPEQKTSTQTDQASKQSDQEGSDMIHKADWIKEKNTHSREMAKSYALVMSCCSKAMKLRIEASLDHEGKTRDDPIEPLKTVRDKMHDPKRNKCPFESITEALQRVIATRQGEKESLTGCAKCHKQGMDIIKSQLG